MQLTIEQYNEIHGTDYREFTPIEFKEYIAYLMEQVKLKNNNEDIFTDVNKLVW